MGADRFPRERELDRRRSTGPPVDLLCAFGLRLPGLFVEQVNGDFAIVIRPEANRFCLYLHLPGFCDDLGRELHVAEREMARLGHSDVDDVKTDISGRFQSAFELPIGIGRPST